MTFTYDPTLSDDVSKLRFILDDTEDIFNEYSDEELSALASMYTSIEKAAIHALRKMILKYSKMATVSQIDDLRIEYRDKAEALQTIVDGLESDIASSVNRFKTAPIYFGGVIKNNYLANKEDTSVVQPRFTRGMNKNSVCKMEDVESVDDECFYHD